MHGLIYVVLRGMSGWVVRGTVTDAKIQPEKRDVKSFGEISTEFSLLKAIFRNVKAALFFAWIRGLSGRGGPFSAFSVFSN